MPEKFFCRHANEGQQYYGSGDTPQEAYQNYLDTTDTPYDECDPGQCDFFKVVEIEITTIFQIAEKTNGE